jgi:hypothetical protein
VTRPIRIQECGVVGGGRVESNESQPGDNDHVVLEIEAIET